MRKHFLFSIMIFLCFSIAGCNPGKLFTSTLTATPTLINTPVSIASSTFTPTITFTPTNTPTITPTPVNPLDTIVLHDANQDIVYRWFSYVPSGLDKTKPVYILLTGLNGYMGTYDDATSQTRSILRERLGWPNINNFVLLAPVIPRIDNPNQDEIYSVAFDLSSFKTADKFAQRADLKVISMIDRLSGLLREDGYNANKKVVIEGFSAGSLFAQRFVILHPDRVIAIAAGGGSNFMLPLSSYNGIPINWPVGINDLKGLSGIDFDQNAYNQISQFIFIGDQDGKIPNTIVFPDSWGVTNMWESVGQRDFLRQSFGTTDPIRMGNEIEYLNSNGFNNITFKVYIGIGHQETDSMVNDKMVFLMRVIEPFYNPVPTPTSSIPIVIDGYANDWAGFSHVTVIDSSGDSFNPDTDITSYSFTQDDNYVDILLQTKAPITKEKATLDIGLSLQTPDGQKQKYEFNINSDGSAYGGTSPDVFHRALGVSVAWKDVVEIQIPKSVFNGSIFIGINYISLFTNFNGNWTAVDVIP